MSLSDLKAELEKKKVKLQLLKDANKKLRTEREQKKVYTYLLILDTVVFMFVIQFFF